MGNPVERCVVTFASTTGAMAMEQACEEAGLPGRLIPVPRSITAGCGLCWASPLEAREDVENLLMDRGLDADGIYTIQFPR